MPLTLANKVSLSVAGVLGLAVLSSLAALLSSWHVRSLMLRTVNENLASVRAAEELEIALLEQRGFVSSYLLDGGNRDWLVKLGKRKNRFGEWLDLAYETAHTPKEREILGELEKVYEQYDVERDDVVALYDGGDVAGAEQRFVREVNRLYDQAYNLCEDFISSNERYVELAMARVRRQIQWVSWAVSGCVVLTISLGAALLWLFFFGVVFPLRAVVADARGFAGDTAPQDGGLPTDELREVGGYLRTLMTDVTDTRTTLERSRGRLREAERLASVGKLAASVAHEIRNPLTSMRMWLFSIQKEVGGEPALDHKFEIVSEEIRRLENIVRNFLEFSRPPELTLRVESISRLLDETLELAEPRIVDRKIRLVRDDAPNLPPVLVDREQLRQVLINLLNNATEATSESGRISVAARAESDPDGRTMVVVRVSDTGVGMLEEVRQRVFEPFFSTKDEGTGLGLCIAARIMARHEGRLVVESSSEAGTTLAVYLPAAPAEPT